MAGTCFILFLTIWAGGFAKVLPQQGYAMVSGFSEQKDLVLPRSM